MLRPVWLFSMDTEQFRAPPLTTGALKAHFCARGRSADATEIELVHFLEAGQIEHWLETDWPQRVRPRATEAAELRPVFGLSCYTWNVAEFLDIARLVRSAVPEALIVAGGPHVQRAADFLFDEALDVVFLGEGEATFTEWLDCADRSDWKDVAGLAFLEGGELITTPERPRETDLDRLPTALDVVPLRSPEGEPLYKQVAYETSRGCPYLCAFCEWGTGAIGTRMYQMSLDRVASDLERLAAGGIEDVWLCDSNFGALREDEPKASMVVELKRRTGLPRTFATSWSKNHNSRVQRIVRMLHGEGLLSHYHLALQTLTPLALELSNRKNMRANDYEPIVKSLAEDGIPVAAELIWGLPGDTLAEFEQGLDHLMKVFPNINIFGYTLLPGTEFYDLRDEYRIESIPVAGYGKAKGEYVVGCHTFPREEGEEGYFLITSYITLARGQLMNLTARYLALLGRVPVSALLRAVLHALHEEFDAVTDRVTAYERRAEHYVAFVAEIDRTYAVIERVIREWLIAHDAVELTDPVLDVLAIDRALCPRTGQPVTLDSSFDFAARGVANALGRMDLPAERDLARGRGYRLQIRHPARVGEVLLDPDGAEWMRGRILTADAEVQDIRA